MNVGQNSIDTEALGKYISEERDFVFDDTMDRVHV